MPTLLRDELVEIPKNRERQFPRARKILKPSRKSVEALVRKIPRGEIATIALLRQALADRHGAQTTCPFLTKRALLAIAKDPSAKAPYWRVVVARGEMIDAYPGGAAAQAKRLKAEGVGIRTNKVADLPDRLASL